jgi:hypothetical protein
LEVASVGGTANGQSASGQNKNGGLAALLGGNKNKGKGKGKGKNSNMLSGLFGGGKGKAKAKGSNMLGSLTALLGGKGANARLAEEEIATAWLENYLRLHRPDAEEDNRLAADVMATRAVHTEQDGNAAPPPSEDVTPPRSAAMGSRSSFRVSQSLRYRQRLTRNRASLCPSPRPTGSLKFKPSGQMSQPSIR